MVRSNFAIKTFYNVTSCDEESIGNGKNDSFCFIDIIVPFSVIRNFIGTNQTKTLGERRNATIRKRKKIFRGSAKKINVKLPKITI